MACPECGAEYHVTLALTVGGTISTSQSASANADHVVSYCPFCGEDIGDDEEVYDFG